VSKTILITGASRGIGRAAAVLAGARGWAVGVNYAGNERAAAETVAAVTDAGGRALALCGDVAAEADVLAMFDATQAAFGPLDGLVNNAGIVAPGAKLADMSAARMARVFAVNVLGAYLCAREAARRMATDRGGRGGAIVNISSAASILGTPGLDTYTAAKGALNALTRSLAVEYAPDNIRVNCIVSGMVLTSEGAWKMMEDPVIGGATKAMHLTRLGMPDDIANAALFLASDESAFVTGAVIPVDGGVTARMPVPDISAADLSLD